MFREMLMLWKMFMGTNKFAAGHLLYLSWEIEREEKRREGGGDKDREGGKRSQFEVGNTVAL